MSFAQLASHYLMAHLLLTLAVLVASLSAAFFALIKMPLSHRAELKFHYTLLALLITLIAATPFMPKTDIFKPIAKVWLVPEPGPRQQDRFAQLESPTETHSYLGFNANTAKFINLNRASEIATLLALAVFLIGGLKLVRDLTRLMHIRRHAFLVRKIKSVYIFVSNEIRVPFSFWLPLQKNVIVPEALLVNKNFKSAVLHELQHHRQKDTQWVYVVWALRLLFFINPFAHMWARWISEVQEFACDEALVDQEKVESLAYASCLVQVAQTALKHETQPVCATGLMFLVERNMLKRRITTMFNNTNRTKLRFRAAMPVLALAMALMGFTAYAAGDLVKDRRITMEQMQKLAKSTKTSEDFPLVVNDLVLKWLNYYVGTTGGREKTRETLTRMHRYEGMMKKFMTIYGVPEELLAVPFIEAGYKNLPPKANPVRAAGLWQFIASTATRYGLEVSTQVDERLIPDLATDAAIRYLLSNRLRFNNWPLGAIAYNYGEASLQKAIERAGGSKDAWVVIRDGIDSTESRHYLPKLIAAILIIKNPSLADD